jgi:anionic cell wall polymer biosynthesis LytR-Cps2A-Psr (LCP) family protein
VDVKDRLRDPSYPCDDNQYAVCGLDIMPGLQHMDGTAALAYSRCRKGTCGNDYGRAARQQEVMRLVVAKMTQSDVILDPPQLNKITKALHDCLETDMNARAVVTFGYDWQQASANEPVSLVLSTANEGMLRGDPLGSSDLVPIGGDFEAIQTKVQNIFASR